MSEAVCDGLIHFGYKRSEPRSVAYSANLDIEAYVVWSSFHSETDICFNESNFVAAFVDFSIILLQCTIYRKMVVKISITFFCYTSTVYTFFVTYAKYEFFSLPVCLFSKG